MNKVDWIVDPAGVARPPCQGATGATGSTRHRRDKVTSTDVAIRWIWTHLLALSCAAFVGGVVETIVFDRLCVFATSVSTISEQIDGGPRWDSKENWWFWAACANARNEGGKTPLHWARNASVIRALLQAGADPDARDAHGRTPLFSARDGPTAVALLQAGADPNARDAHGRTPLFSARDGPTAVALLQAGADPNATVNGNRLLHEVVTDIRPKNQAKVAALLDAGAEPDRRDSNGLTALHVLTLAGSEHPLASDYSILQYSEEKARQMAMVLLNGGAGLSVATPSGYPTLAASAYYNKPRSTITNTILSYHFPSLHDKRPTPATPHPSTPSRLGLGLHRARCWFDHQLDSPLTECSFMVVTEDPMDAESTLIAFPVIRFTEEPLNSQGPSRNPVLHLGGGGPGSPLGLERPLEIWDRYKFLVKGTGRDLYVVDPRGVGMAYPRLHCLPHLRLVREAIRAPISIRTEFDVWRTVYRECKENDLFETNLSNYNSDVVARDFELLRRAIGVRQWVLYGVSGGSRYALAMAERFPRSIETMVLDGAAFVSSSPGSYLTERFWHAYFDRLFSNACIYLHPFGDVTRRTEVCRPAKLENRFWNVVSELDRKPLFLESERRNRRSTRDGAVPSDFMLTGSRLLDVVFLSSYDALFLRNFPEFVRTLERREVIWNMWDYIVGSAVGLYVDFLVDPEYSDPVWFSHLCAEEYPHVRLNPDGDRLKVGLEERSRRIRDILLHGREHQDLMCAMLNVTPVDVVRDATTISAPTLFLQGALDPATPVDYLWENLDRFAKRSVLLFENESHWRTEEAETCAMVAGGYYIEHKMLREPLECTDLLVQTR